MSLKQYEVTIAAFSTANLPVIGDYVRLGFTNNENVGITVVNGDYASQAQFILGQYESVKLNREFEELIFENTTDGEKTYVITVGRGSVFLDSTKNVNLVNQVLNVEAATPLNVYESFQPWPIVSAKQNVTDTEADLVAALFAVVSDWAGGDFLTVQNKSATQSVFIGFGYSEPLADRYEIKPNQEFKLSIGVRGDQLLTAICQAGQNADVVLVTSYHY